MSERISQSELESYLWDSAVYLRTNIDAGAYKQYIFPLLFFKRLCDVYDEAYQKALDISGGDEEFARLSSYDFVIPEGSHWNDVRAVSENVGEALVSAFRSIERENPDKLSGIFGSAAWTNKRRLSDALLKNLIEHFSSQTLSLARCPEDELGHGYEYLIKKFADDSGHTAQEFYTNRTVVHLMTEILQPNEGESVYDPTCGSAGMLISCVHYVKEHGKDARTLAVYGQEFNALTASIARMNLFLHGVKEFEIVQEDTLLHPGFIEEGKLMRFNVVLANPPYSISEWNREAFAADKYGRNFLGVPPQGRADYAFIQHILKSLDEKNGRCAILLPHGILSRGEEATVRENLVKSDLLECVIGIGPNLFYNSPMVACILICRTNKPETHKGKVLFIKADKEVTRTRSNSFLEDTHIQKITKAYTDFRDESEFSKIVTLDEIQEQKYTLAIPYYVHCAVDGVTEIIQSVSTDEVLNDWITSSDKLHEEFSKLTELLDNREGK